MKQKEKGQGLVEYGLLLSLIVLVVIVGAIAVGANVSPIFKTMNDVVGGYGLPRPGETGHDTFEMLDTSIWSASDRNLGRTHLNPANVFVNGDSLQIKMPANTLEGGQLVKTTPVLYGTYEARMQLPLAPSSITGFFLYCKPDYFYEIDIEIHNSPEGKILFTTYADGATQNEYVGYLGFDPTADFHDYRFEYYPESTSFYVDNKLFQTWTTGMPVDQPMRLMINSWYPNWLPGTKPPTDQFLLVDWVRY